MVSFTGFGSAQPQHGLVENPDRERHQRQRIDKCREHTRPMIAVGLGFIRRLGLQVEAGPRQAQRQGIREIVAGIGEQRQRIRL